MHRAKHRLAIYILNVRAGDYARAEPRRLERACIVLTQAAPTSQEDVTLMTRFLERALHRDDGWLTGTVCAIVVRQRLGQMPVGRSAASIFDKHEGRQTATRAFVTRDHGGEPMYDTTVRKLMRFDYPGWTLEEAIASAKQAFEDLEVLSKAGDAREVGYRCHILGLLARVCVSPTFDRNEAVRKTHYLDAVRVDALGRDPSAYLLVSTTIEQELERWEPGSVYDRAVCTLH